jgi:hypothetical protein
MSSYRIDFIIPGIKVFTARNTIFNLIRIKFNERITLALSTGNEPVLS